MKCTLKEHKPEPVVSPPSHYDLVISGMTKRQLQILKAFIGRFTNEEVAPRVNESLLWAPTPRVSTDECDDILAIYWDIDLKGKL